MGRLIQLFTPYMRRQQAGKIVDIASMGGKIYTPLGAWYHATKHAVEGLFDSLRLELKPFGVDVIVIQPGIILTDFGAVLDGPLQKFSGNGAYADLAAKVARGTADTYAKGNGSSNSGRGRRRVSGAEGPPPQDPLRRGQIRKLPDGHPQMAWRPHV